MIRRKLFSTLAVFFFFLGMTGIFSESALARKAGDFSDLYEDDRKYYGSEKEEKFSVNAFLVEKEDWEAHHALMVFGFFKKTDYPRYYSLRILPFYYRLESKVDDRRRTLIPLLPFTWYNRVDGNDELTWSIPYYSHIRADSYLKSILYLFWWGGDTQKNAWKQNWFFTPLAYWSRYREPDKKIVEKIQINPLYFLDSYKRPGKNRYTWWAPIVPLMYHHRNHRGGHRNLFWLLDYSWKTNRGVETMKRFWFMPLVFWGRDRYFHLAPLFFMTRKYNRVPALAGERVLERRTIVTPLFVSYRRNWWHDGVRKSGGFWFPIVPLVYHSSSQSSGSHTNLFWLLDWSRGQKGKLKRFWFMPLWFSGHGSSKYCHILPPLYMSWSDHGGSYRHILPFYFAWNSRDHKYDADKNVTNLRLKSRYLTPLGGWFQENELPDDERKASLVSRSIWFPIVPVIYSSYDRKEGYHKNLFWLFDWKKRNDGTLKRFWFIPLVWYDGDPLGYRIFAPFYFSHGSNRKYRGTSYGLFHYHSWDENREVIWAWPWYSWKKTRSSRYYRHALPVYYSWKLKKSSGLLVFPFYLNYKSKRRSLTVNLLGASKSLFTGPFSPSLGVGKYKGKWYLDTDWSWFYDLASMATRVTIGAPDKKKETKVENIGAEHGIALVETREENINVKEEKAADEPLLSKKRTFDRDNSRNFFGLKLLFGWLAYERGDTRRHFRLLPLSWFTWDTASDDRIYVAPPFFLWYKSKLSSIEYFVLFPFYGSQKEKSSWMRAWLLNLYWDEYNAKEKLREHDILWPIVNWYTSPKRAGWRIFPLVWHRKKFSEKGRREQYISPLFYSSAEFNLEGEKEKTAYRHIINPLFYYRKKTAEKENYSHLALPIVPLFYHGTRMSTYRYKVPVFNKDKNRSGVKEITYIDTNKTHFLFPFYWFSGMERRGEAKKTDLKKGSLVGLPLLYYSFKNSLNSEGTTDSYRRFFLLGYHWNRSPGYAGHSLLLGLYKYENFERKETSVHSLLWGLVNITSKKGGGGSSRFIPFYSYRSRGGTGRLRLIFGVAGQYNWYKNGNRSFYGFMGLFHGGKYYEKKNFYAGAKYQQLPVEINRSWFFPLYFHRSVSGKGEGSEYSRSFHWNLLLFLSRERNSSNGSEDYYSRFWFPVLPLVYRYASKKEVHWNLFTIIDWSYSRDGKRGGSFFLPFYYYKRDWKGSQVNVLGIFDHTNRYNGKFQRFMFFPLFARYEIDKRESHFFLPALFSYHGRGKDWRTTVVLGTYWHRSAHYSRQNIWLLFDHRYHAQKSLESFRAFLGTFRYDRSPEIRRVRLFYGLLARYDNYLNKPDYNFDVLGVLAHARRHGDHFSHSFQPLWYYSRTGEEWKFYSIAGLTWIDHNHERNFDLGLLGLAWYRNERHDEFKDRRMVLLGTLWHEVKKPVRKYHSRGMFWGLLWNYETEEETGFKKISILKGLYKRTVIKGKVKQKFLWVF